MQKNTVAKAPDNLVCLLPNKEEYNDYLRNFSNYLNNYLKKNKISCFNILKHLPWNNEIRLFNIYIKNASISLLIISYDDHSEKLKIDGDEKLKKLLDELQPRFGTVDEKNHKRVCLIGHFHKSMEEIRHLFSNIENDSIDSTNEDTYRIYSDSINGIGNFIIESYTSTLAWNKEISGWIRGEENKKGIYQLLKEAANKIKAVNNKSEGKNEKEKQIKKILEEKKKQIMRLTEKIFQRCFFFSYFHEAQFSLFIYRESGGKCLTDITNALETIKNITSYEQKEKINKIVTTWNDVKNNFNSEKILEIQRQLEKLLIAFLEEPQTEGRENG